MTRIKKFLVGLGRTGRVIVASTFVLFVAAGIAQAATTISTNISTDGTLSVTGVSTLTNASTTNSATVAGPLWINGNATTTAAGALSLQSTLSVTGVSTFTNASTTNSASIAGPLWINGNATTTAAGAISTQSTLNVLGNTTLASTTATTMKVGQLGTGMTRIVSGYCVTSSVTIPASSTASSTPTFAECTPSGGASIISSGDRVFVQATSSLPSYVILQAASSTSVTAGSISTNLLNTSTSTSPAAAIYAFNFWAFQ